MSKVQLIVSALLLILLVAACASKAGPTAEAPAAPAKAAWQGEWDKLVAAAKQEGKVEITSGSNPEASSVLVEGMRGFGITAEITFAQTLTARAAAIKAERRAGLYLRDIYLGAASTILNTYKPVDDLFEYPLDSQLMLPDITESERIAKLWYQGKFWWVDKDHVGFITANMPRPVIVINTNLVKEGEIRSYRDLLNSKWKGKIFINDPTVSGAGQVYMQGMYMAMGKDFMKELAKMEPMFTRDVKLHMDWLAQGKMPIALAPQSELVTEYLRVGAPIRIVTPVEGGVLFSAGSGLFLWRNAAHPTAAKLFLNWITTKEAQEPFSQGNGYHSLRLDVSTAHLSPDEMRQPGVKYIDLSAEEAATVVRPEFVKMAKEVFEPLIKK